MGRKFKNRGSSVIAIQCLGASWAAKRRDESALATKYNFSFKVRPEDQIVELAAEHHTVHVCLECLVLLTVHHGVHHVKVEKVIVEMAERRPAVAEVNKAVAECHEERLPGRAPEDSFQCLSSKV